MSRSVSQTLLDAIANQQGETILRVKTWADLAAYNLAPTVAETTWETTKFEIKATSASALIISPSNDYTVSDFTVFLIERGVSISGVEYVTQSDIFFVTKYNERPGMIELEGSSYPDQKIILEGDDTYENVITAFCTAIGKTAVFKDSGAAWLSYQFFATGKQVILNKAARFESLIRQKYLIQCYARSPKELVFYHAATEQSVWKNIIFADSTLVLAASSGSHQIATSSDGLGYTKTTAPSFTNALAYSPTLDLFVAVGNGVCITSPDGITWTSRTIGAGNWKDVIWDANLAKFIAVRIGATATSSNGTTWAIHHQATAGSWVDRTDAGDWYRSVCWSPELSLFVAVAQDPLTDTYGVMTSPDGITWTGRTSPKNQWTSVCWSPELSLFVAVAFDNFEGVSTGTDQIMYSSNGINWTSIDAPIANSWVSVCWSPELSLFVAVSTDGSNRAMTSPNGTTWTIRSLSSSYLYTSVCWSPELSLFVAVAHASSAMTSPDGITWTQRTAPSSNDWNSVCWSPELSLFVAVAGSGTNRVMTSPDGITWTARAESSSYIWQSVTYCAALSLFVAVSSSHAAIMKSSNGINWTTETVPNVNYAIVWAPEIFTFVAVSSDIATSHIATPYYFSAITTDGVGTLAAVGVDTAFTSSNGSSWTTRTIPSGTYNKIIYSDGLFVAVGSSKCATSPDGITWTSRTIPAGNYLGLAYSSTLDLFVAIGDNLLATSPDGITWTTRAAPADQAWQAVAWSDSLAKFFTVSSDGDNRIASSDDGINWQTLTTSADFSLDYLDGPRSSIEHGTKQVYFIWRKEDASTGSEGDTSYPAWNLGYLESTDSPPQTNADPFYKFYIQKAPLRLDMTDGDRVHFSPSWTLDPTKAIDAMITIVEIFDTTKSPAWYQDIRSLAIFDGVEGGALPSTIERVAAYTPLVSSGFNGNLTPEVNNLQALAEAMDNLTLGGTYDLAADIHAATSKATPVDADELGIWDSVANTLKKLTWANIKATLKTYFDTFYVALTGNQTIAGVKTFSSDPIIPDEAYDATAWNGSLEPPTKNAVRDKIESMGSGGGTWGSITGTLASQTDLQTALNNKLDDSQLDTDGTLAANSDTKIASQKATKTYADNVSSNTSVIAKLLTGFTSGAGTVSASDSILSAFQKVVGNIALKLTANSPITGATKTKITYDSNGLVTSGADAKAHQTYNGNGLNGTIAAGATQ